MNEENVHIVPSGPIGLSLLSVETIVKHNINPEAGEIDNDTSYLLEMFKKNDCNWNKVLIYACQENDISLVKGLVKNSIDVNYNENKESTRDYENIDGFAPQNIKVPVQDPNSSQALKVASENGYLDIVKFLVEEAGAKVRDTEETALFQAAANGHLDVVRYLFEKGACFKINHYNNIGLILAAQNKHLDVVKYLCEGVSCSNPYITSFNPQNPKIGVEVKIFGNMPLQHAVKNNDLEMAKYFISVGANKNYHCVEHTCENSYLEMVKILVKSENDILSPIKKPLTLAVKNRHFEIIRYLCIEIGININNTDALCRTTYSGDLEMVQFLIENDMQNDLYGTSLGISDIHIWNECALECAIRNNQLEMVKYLCAAGANIGANSNNALRKASGAGYLDIVKVLIEYIPKELINHCINDKPDYYALYPIDHFRNQNSLELAIKGNYTELVEYLKLKFI